MFLLACMHLFQINIEYNHLCKHMIIQLCTAIEEYIKTTMQFYEFKFFLGNGVYYSTG